MIKFSVEELFHFNCGFCKRWWTVGDWEPVEVMACPHCGNRQCIEPEPLSKEVK